MSTPNKKIIQGVESLELAVIDANGVIGTYVRAENVAAGTVNYTSNADTETPIIPEDKDTAIIVLSTPGDADVFNFGLLEFSEENLAKLFNAEQDLATSMTTVLAQRKRASMAIRLTTRPVNGVKKVFVYPNTTCVTSILNNFTKDALVQLSIAASVLAYTTVNGKDAIYTVQTVKADGSTINSVPPTLSAGADSTSSSATKALLATATYDSGKTAASIQWSQVSGPNTAGFSAPNALSTNATGLITGTYVFKIVVVDSDGASSTDTVSIVVTIP